MTNERTGLGRENETALGEVLAHVRGETELSCRIVDDPAAGRIVALRKRLGLSRQRSSRTVSASTCARSRSGNRGAACPTAQPVCC